ncbi:MAG: DEAD/DEAH box helicase [Mycoplasmatales bacterium]|nr:DEAD/DEAH box helicase [Mycoplasmatales bacterium]
MLNKMIDKLIKCKINNLVCKFTNEELDYIHNKWTIGSNSDNCEKKLAYLIINTKNNLPKYIQEKIKNTISIINLDIEGVDDSNISFANAFKGIEVKNIGEFKPTFKQISVVQSLISGKNIALIAGTGFGKTTIFYNYFKEKIKKNPKSKKKYVICVPTELLETQIIQKLSLKNSDITIGNNIYFDQFLICTPEKLGLLLKYKPNEINEILFDEAHTLLTQDDHRSVYAKYIFDEVKEICPKVHITSPFLSKKEIEKFEYKFNAVIRINKQDHQNKHLLLIGDNIVSDIDENKLTKKTNKEMQGITLIYHPSSNKVKEMAAKKRDSRDIEYIKKLIINIDNKYIEKYNQKFNNPERKKMEKYLGISIVQRGVAYFHGSMPNNIKVDILWAIQHGFVDCVFATHSILNGIDLPIDNLIIEKTKIHRKNMKINDFNNLIGRVGRWTTAKRSTNFGISILNKTVDNMAWLEKHKSQIKEQKEYIFDAHNYDIYFTNESLKRFEETFNSDYKIDVRINPITTEKVMIKKLKNHKTLWEDLFYNPTNKKSKALLEDMISELFELYKLDEYDSRYRKKEINEEEAKEPKVYQKMILNATLSFLVNGTVEKSMNNYIGGPALKNKSDEYEWTHSFESRLERVKTYGKHYFNMFVCHYLEIHFTHGKLHKFKAYQTKDEELIAVIQNNELEEEWKELIDLNTRRWDPKYKDLETTIKTISRWRKKREEFPRLFDFFKSNSSS